ncbi:hypothetical protein CRYUN_Cryun01aG0170600 [Craigia yunnanensis]
MGLVEQAFEESRQNLLENEPLISLSLGLAKCGLSIPASTILRKLVIYSKMGACTPRKKSNAPLIAMKLNTTAFNIGLVGCLLFETRKAEQLLDMMPQIGVKVDANLLIVMAHIYERNGRRGAEEASEAHR